ncbi:hypothetical protein [Serratia marcescens]|uniref:hypothetical protein n=1 Tax=Serratia marcescens TaxID=615 RepID=UPI00128E23AE|nr:hypothetical protein [Serratia marcescens]
MTHQTHTASITIHVDVAPGRKTPLRQLIERRQEMPRRLITLEDPPEGRILCMPLPEEPADEN